MTGLELYLIAMACRKVHKWLTDTPGSGNTNSTQAQQIEPPQKVITLIGRTGAGKSSTGNALLGYSAFTAGAEHGSTTQVVAKTFTNGYTLRDTPGLLDGTGYEQIALTAAKDSELTIYTTTGQLYRAEVEFIDQLHQHQISWDTLSGTPGKRRMALFVNMQDVKDATMPKTVRERERHAIQQQVAEWIPCSHILYGAASPVRQSVSQPPNVEALRDYVTAHIASNSP